MLPLFFTEDDVVIDEISCVPECPSSQKSYCFSWSGCRFWFCRVLSCLFRAWDLLKSREASQCSQSLHRPWAGVLAWFDQRLLKTVKSSLSDWLKIVCWLVQRFTEMRADIVDRVLLILPDSMRKLIQMFVHILGEARTKLLASVVVRFRRATLADWWWCDGDNGDDLQLAVSRSVLGSDARSLHARSSTQARAVRVPGNASS